MKCTQNRAGTDAGKPVAESLYAKLRQHNVWVWLQGEIEGVLGSSGKKGEAERAEFCKKL